MKVLAVAQAFKETLTLSQVARGLEEGIQAAGASPVVVPGSDGGDGLLDALGHFLVRNSDHSVTGPLGRAVDVQAGWLSGREAVVESRLVCGLALVPRSRRDPSRTTTRGLGELLLKLERAGAEEVHVGLGGSATMDGGLGMAQAWGWSAIADDGAELGEGGGVLASVAELRPGRVPRLRITGLVDVRHPLTGPAGARAFAVQKGATPEMADRLALGLHRLAQVSGRPDLANEPGAGAAGGLGFGLRYFGAGSLVEGARWVLSRTGFDSVLSEAGFVIATEGAFDESSVRGKLAGTVIEAARHAGIPAGVVAPAVAGVPDGVLAESGPGTWDVDALARHTAELVRRALRAERPV